MAEEGLVTIENCPKDLLLFRAAVSTIFRNISESVSADEFSNSWTILKKKRKASHQLYKSIVNTMYENMVVRIEEFIVEDNLMEKFYILRRLSEESNTLEDHVAWRPPGDVTEHLRTLDAERIKEHSVKLEEYVTKVEAENQKLMQQVSKGRAAAKHFDKKADHLLNQEKRVRLEFEKTARQLEGDIKKMHGCN